MKAAICGRALTRLLLLVFIIAHAGCSRSSDARPDKQRKQDTVFPVEAIAAEVRQVDYVVTGIGSVEAFEQVEVTARVAGVVERLRFQEGDTVKKNTVLVEIEPQRYQLAVRSAKATLDRVLVSKSDAERNRERRERMESEGIASVEEVETSRTRVSATAAEENQARASLALAELNLRDAFVRAPIGGVIQSRTVRTGQFVQVGEVLASLVQRDPMLLRFQVTEKDARRLQVGMTAKFTIEGFADPGSAKITFVAQAANMTSRMVSVVAEIEQPDERLRPGAFAEVTVAVGASQNSPVIPQMAVRPSEKGFLAYVVTNGRAEERVLELGMRTEEGLLEVRAGIQPGEQVVIRGAEALHDGAAVKVEVPTESPMTKPTTQPTAAPTQNAIAP